MAFPRRRFVASHFEQSLREPRPEKLTPLMAARLFHSDSRSKLSGSNHFKSSWLLRPVFDLGRSDRSCSV